MMMMHIDDDRLQDYADDVLGEGDRAEVERHLALCASCFGSTQQLRALLGDLAMLPRAIAPGEDLRPAIHAAIEKERAAERGVLPLRRPWGERSLRSMRVPLAAAAIVLISLSSALTALWVEKNARPTTLFADAPRALAPEEFRMLEANYIAATSELESVLRAQRGALPPETTRIIEENLAIIDRALAEASAALRTAPGDQALSEMLVAAYEKKLDLLRRAAEIPVTRGGI